MIYVIGTMRVTSQCARCVMGDVLTGGYVPAVYTQDSPTSLTTERRCSSLPSWLFGVSKPVYTLSCSLKRKAK